MRNFFVSYRKYTRQGLTIPAAILAIRLLYSHICTCKYVCSFNFVYDVPCMPHMPQEILITIFFYLKYSFRLRKEKKQTNTLTLTQLISTFQWIIERKKIHSHLDNVFSNRYVSSIHNCWNSSKVRRIPNSTKWTRSRKMLQRAKKTFFIGIFFFSILIFFILFFIFIFKSYFLLFFKFFIFKFYFFLFLYF